jgi:hypothetical protein
MVLKLPSILALAVLGHVQPGVDGGVAGCEGVPTGYEDRMGWIDVRVPAADGAVNRIEDQAGRRGLVALRDHKVRRRVVDDAGGVAPRPEAQGRRPRRRPRYRDRLRQDVAGAVVECGQPGGERIGHAEGPVRHGDHAPAVQVGVGEVPDAGLVTNQVNLLVSAGNRAVFQYFKARPMRRGAPRAPALASARREGGAEILQPTVE